MKLEPAEIDWSPEGLPYSPGFGDLYFSKEDGLAETRHTFLNGNLIEERFAQLANDAQFSILETGFGTGLNFLATLEAWHRLAPPTARLNFVSIEAYPLDIDDLKRAHALWPELKSFAEPLADSYPHLTPGFHLMEIGPHIRLILIFNQANESLKQLAGPAHPALLDYLPNRIDACYLDGFAPRVNPDMWDGELFPLIASLCKESATLATFTAAGAVRRSLQDSGFEVKRVPGYGRKREMISAKLLAEERASKLLHPSRRKPLASWSLSQPRSIPDSVTILGAGIAGITLADKLARQGVSVSLIDACDQPMRKASGNAQAALFARLSPDPGDLEDFALTALEYASRYYRDNSRKEAFHSCGLIQLPRKAGEQSTMERVGDRLQAASAFIRFLPAENLSELAGITLPSAGLWTPQSGWINPAALAKKLLDHPQITGRFNTPISKIIQSELGWRLLDAQGDIIEDTNCLVVCAGNTAKQLSGLGWLPTRNIRGQVSLVRHPEIASLRTLVCAHGYLAPPIGDTQSLGASYDLDNDGEDVTEHDHRQNLGVLEKLTGLNDAQIVDGRAAVRCATPDYLPICGPAPDVDQTRTLFAALGKDAKRHILSPGPNLEGLYLNLGYGSRGFCYAPLCAEFLANQILGAPLPLPHYLAAALHPSRFIIRDIIRNKN